MVLQLQPMKPGNSKGGKEGASVVIQGFGCVGASCVNSLYNMGYKVVGIADVNGLVYCKRRIEYSKIS